MKERAKQIIENIDAIAKAKATVDSLTTGTGRKKRGTAASCSEVPAKITRLVQIVDETPASPYVATICLEISEIVDVKCSVDEVTNIKAKLNDLQNSADKLDEIYEQIIEDMKGILLIYSKLSFNDIVIAQSGISFSKAEIAASTAPATTTTTTTTTSRNEERE